MRTLPRFNNRVVLTGGPVSRYNMDGTLDTTFGVLGTTNSVASVGNVALQSNGSIVGVGSFFNVPAPAGPRVTELMALRLGANGQLDATSGSGGGAVAPPPSGSLLPVRQLLFSQMET